MSGWGIVLAIHVLGAAIWVGGMFFAILVLRPSLAVLAPPQRVTLHQQVFRRFFLFIWHAMPLVLLSGYLMLFGYFGGFANVGWTVHVMHLFGLIMAAVFVGVVFVPYRRFRAAADTPAAADAADMIRKLIGFNLALGLATIAVAALGRL